MLNLISWIVFGVPLSKNPLFLERDGLMFLFFITIMAGCLVLSALGLSILRDLYVWCCYN